MTEATLRTKGRHFVFFSSVFFSEAVVDALLLTFTFPSSIKEEGWKRSGAEKNGEGDVQARSRDSSRIKLKARGETGVPLHALGCQESSGIGRKSS